MKISRPILVLILSLMAGLMAVTLAARWLQAQAGGTTRLAVAAVDVPLGTPLEASMLTDLNWPSGNLPAGAQTDAGALIGRVTRTALTRHEPILEGKLAPLGSRGGLSAAITPGKRAITVKVNEVMGVAGFALPGGLVDVMVNTHTEDGALKSSASLSKIVLERILVLAVAQDAARDANAPRVANAVTLEVTPEQAEQLDLARSVGTLSLVLRNPVDHSPGLSTGADKAGLLKRTLAAHNESGTGRAEPPRPRTATSSGQTAPRRPAAADTGPTRGRGEPETVEVMRGLSRSDAPA